MASRHFSKTSTDISITCWLIFTSAGGARLTRDEPDLKTGERAMHITTKLPLALFRTPSLSGTITVAKDQAQDAIVAQVEHNAAAVLKQHMGLELSLTVKK